MGHVATIVEQNGYVGDNDNHAERMYASAWTDVVKKGGETMTETQDVSELRYRLRSLLPMLAERYQVASVALFGSYVRAEQRPDSDLDVLVTFAETPSLFEFIWLEQFLTDQLGVRVDLVMRDALKSHIGEQILHEATLV